MKKQLKTIVYILFIVITACITNSDNSDITKIEINHYANNTYKLTEIAENITYIPLYSDDSIQIASIGKLAEYENKYYILDNGDLSRSSMQLYAFNTDGGFYKKIGSKGKGPTEYVRPSDFFVRNDTLFVSDIGSNSIMTFKCSGEIIEKKYYPGIYIPRFYKYNGYYAVLSLELLPSETRAAKAKSPDGKISSADFLNEYVWGVWLLNAEKPDSVLHKFIKTKFKNTWFSYSPFFEYKNSLLFTAHFNDTIFELNGNKETPKYYVDFGKYSITEKFVEESNRYSGVIITNSEGQADYTGAIDYIYETEKYIGFSYLAPKKLFGCIYSKKRNFAIAEHQLINDINGGPVSSSLNRNTASGDLNTAWLTVTPNNEILGYILAEDFIAHCEKNKDKISAEVNEIYKKLTPYSNPVLMKIKLK